jgi:hypothetical protein
MNEQTAQQEAQADHPVNALRQWVNASIARRITAFAFPFTLILTCLLGWGLYQHRSSLVEERITKEFTASVTGASKDFAYGVNALLDEHGRLATNTLIITGLASPKGKEAYLDPYFHTYRPPSGLRAIVSVYDTKGNSLAGAGGPAESHENTPWFGRVVALNTTYVDLSDKNNALLLTIARPVQASRTAIRRASWSCRYRCMNYSCGPFRRCLKYRPSVCSAPAVFWRKETSRLTPIRSSSRSPCSQPNRCGHSA